MNAPQRDLDAEGFIAFTREWVEWGRDNLPAEEQTRRFETALADAIQFIKAQAAALVSVEADLATPPHLVVPGFGLFTADRAAELTAALFTAREALREIAMKPKRFNPVAGYQFDVDVASIAAAALAQIEAGQDREGTNDRERDASRASESSSEIGTDALARPVAPPGASTPAQTWTHMCHELIRDAAPNWMRETPVGKPCSECGMTAGGASPEGTPPRGSQFPRPEMQEIGKPPSGKTQGCCG